MITWRPIPIQFCDGCDKLLMETNRNPQNEKLDNLISLIEKLMEKYEAIESKLDKKFNADDAQQHRTRIDRIEERLANRDKEFDHRFVSVENQLQSKVTNCALWKDNGLSDEEIIKHAVQEEINNKKAEETDLENRKRNIIIYRVPEKKNDNITERKQNDTTFIGDLLDCVFDIKLEDGDNLNGCTDSGAGQRTRPDHC